MKPDYKSPELRDLGTVEQLTEQFNKNGPNPDQFSQVVPIIGSQVTPAP
jgi:hypothetical protein